jgi:hypothetical protein
MKIGNPAAKEGGGGKVKVNSSLCLIKHHAMNTYWGSGGTTPRILNLGTGSGHNHVPSALPQGKDLPIPIA